ncbi:hypothetical protein ACQJBY_067504 [Aegilops geniculata]
MSVLHTVLLHPPAGGRGFLLASTLRLFSRRTFPAVRGRTLPSIVNHGARRSSAGQEFTWQVGRSRSSPWCPAGARGGPSRRRPRATLADCHKCMAGMGFIIQRRLDLSTCMGFSWRFRVHTSHRWIHPCALHNGFISCIPIYPPVGSPSYVQIISSPWWPAGAHAGCHRSSIPILR